MAVVLLMAKKFPDKIELELFKLLLKYPFLQRKVLLPKSSVASVSEIKLVLMATEAKLDKAVLAPAPPAVRQVPEASKKQPPVKRMPLAKVEEPAVPSIFN